MTQKLTEGKDVVTWAIVLCASIIGSAIIIALDQIF